MTLCPYALVAGCEECPILKICTLNSVIGNQPKKAHDKAKEAGKD